MADAAYRILAEQMEERGIPMAAVKAALHKQRIETPSWGYADAGTRFHVFPWPGAARTVFEKIDDAAVVQRFTGIAPSVAIHIPWDRPANDDWAALRTHAKTRGLAIGAVNPNVFQENPYRLGSLGNPSRAIRARAIEQIVECCDVMRVMKSKALSLWFADGTNYAGQDDLRSRRRRMEEGLKQVYAHLPDDARMLVEYKFFEPAFYSTDIPDWGTAYALCLALGSQAQVLVDLGHHAPGVNIEQIVSFLLDAGRLGGFHLNNRKYADDDLMAGSVNPFELFLIYNELAAAGSAARNVAYMIDQSHNIEGKVAPMILSVMNCQEAYAKALLVPRRELAAAQAAGDVLRAHQLIADAHRTDVRPLLACVREEMGIAVNPLNAYRKSGYEQKIAAERKRPAGKSKA